MLNKIKTANNFFDQNYMETTKTNRLVSILKLYGTSKRFA